MSNTDKNWMQRVVDGEIKPAYKVAVSKEKIEKLLIIYNGDKRKVANKLECSLATIYNRLRN